jgi:uncharacterized tellurite resistance protein B-like protein
MVWVLAIAGLLALTAIVSVLVFYVMFRRTDAGRWQHDVRARLTEALGLQRKRRNELESAGREEERDAAARREEALENHLRGIPVSELERYPGIGPVTIERLEASGYRRVNDLRGARLDIPGLGEKRIAELNHAVRGVIEAARSRFDAGACPEAHRLGEELKDLRRRRMEREANARAQLRGIEGFLTALQPFIDAANKISFWNYLRKQFASSDAADLKHQSAASLPELEQFLHMAQRPAPRVQPAEALPVAVPVEPAPGPSWVAVPVEEPSRRRSHDKYPIARPADGWVATEPAAPPAPPRAAADELEQVVAFAWAVARADGRVARAEREAIDAFLRRRYGEDSVRLSRALNLCAHYEAAAIDVEACLKFLAEHSDMDPQALFNLAIGIADATGPRNEREAAFLKRVAAALRVPFTQEPASAPAPKAPETAPRTALLATLEIEATTAPTAGLVRRQFNLLAERYAPERVAHAADLQEIAKAKLATIRAAATTLLAEWGEPLDQPRTAAPPELRHNPDLDALFGAT